MPVELRSIVRHRPTPATRCANCETQREYADAELFFITGADALAGLPTWREYPEVLEMATFVAVTRPGHDLDALLPKEGGKVKLLTIPEVDISSTTIRRRLADGLSIADLTPSRGSSLTSASVASIRWRRNESATARGRWPARTHLGTGGRGSTACETTPPRPELKPTPTPSPSAVGTPDQSTLLVAVRDENSFITDAVVHGAVTKPNTIPVGSWLSMQPGLAIAVNNLGSVSLSQRGPFAPADVARDVSNELGFDVDGALVVDRLAFAALVDSVGGVSVNSPVPIVAIDADGKRRYWSRQASESCMVRQLLSM